MAKSLIVEVLNDEKFSKALGQAQDGVEKLRKIVDQFDSKDFVSTQRTAVAYLLEDVQAINKKLNGK